MAERVGPEGSVSGLDCTHEFLDIATREQRAAEVPNASYLLGDVEAAPLEAGSFDAAVAYASLSQPRRRRAGLKLEQVQQIATDPHGCYRRLRVQHAGGYLGHDQRRMVCVYYTPDPESVRQGNREYGTPWQHLWSGELHSAPAT